MPRVHINSRDTAYVFHAVNTKSLLTQTGDIVSVFVDIIGIALISYLFSGRVARIKSWRKLAVARWCILLIYVASFLFIFASAVTKSGFGLDGNPRVCAAASLLCVMLYFTTKVFIYFFLVERVQLVSNQTSVLAARRREAPPSDPATLWLERRVRSVRANGCPRFKDKVWLFNTFGILLPYVAAEILALIFRSGTLRSDGKCILVLMPTADISVIALDILVNIYLTTFFLVPLVRTYSFRRQSSRRLRRVAKRALIGCVGTLLPTIVNMGVMLGLGKEYGWLCLMTCNLDILVSALVLHWVTADTTDDDELRVPANPSPPMPWCPLCSSNTHSSGAHSCSRGSRSGQASAGGSFSKDWYPGHHVSPTSQRLAEHDMSVITTISGPELGSDAVAEAAELENYPPGRPAGIKVKIEQTQEVHSPNNSSAVTPARRDSIDCVSLHGLAVFERRPSMSKSMDHIHRIDS